MWAMDQTSASSVPPWEPPVVEWISLDCEISSYAPDSPGDGGDTPLF